MAQLSNLIVNGVSRLLSKLYVSDSVTAPEFIGKLTGNADSATKVNGHTVNSDVPANAKFTDTTYTHPTTSGNKHIPSGGSSGQILRWSADGTAAWGADNNTTYSVATTSANGLMSSTDKSKLDGIATGANKTTVDSSLSSTSTNPVQNKVINSALAGKLPISGGTISGSLGVNNNLTVSGNGQIDGTIILNGASASYSDGDIVILDSSNELHTRTAAQIRSDIGAASSGHDHSKVGIYPSAIELAPASTSAGNGGYIDFHYNASSDDYTSRIIETNSGYLRIIATLLTLKCHITCENLDKYYALEKSRTVSSVPHKLTVGVAAGGASTLEHYTNGTLDGRIELSAAGLTMANGTGAVDTKLMRNIYAGTGSMTAKSTALTTGCIYMQYS